MWRQTGNNLIPNGILITNGIMAWVNLLKEGSLFLITFGIKIPNIRLCLPYSAGGMVFAIQY